VSFLIRDADSDEIERLVAITLANYREVFEPLLPHCDWATLGELFAHAGFTPEVLPQLRVIAKAGEPPLGYSKVTDGHIDRFFIDRAGQSRGAGAALLADAAARGARSLECFALNAGARRFYERHGWRKASAYRRAFAGAECEFVRYEIDAGPVRTR
jgi:putative acetyltransferase